MKYKNYIDKFSEFGNLAIKETKHKPLDKKLLDIVQSMASALSIEKAYKISEICSKYELGDGTAYQSPTSKEKFIRGLLLNKDEKFLVDLSNRIINDYRSDEVSYALNAYYGGKFFKLSVVTRKELLSALYSLGDLNGNRDINDFLKECDMEKFIPINSVDVLNILFGGAEKQKEKDLVQILEENKIYEVTDSRFFTFLEQIVHPYTRNSVSSKQYSVVINQHLAKDGLILTSINEISGQTVYKVVQKNGVNEGVKNLIFASSSYKPEIVLDDALSNRIRIVKNEEHCLVYDKPIKETGLLWVELVEWWSDKNGGQRNQEQAINLKRKLSSSLASPPEKILFDTYYQVFSKRLNRNLPALIPQVYLHYDPYSIKQYGIQYLTRQRMDFLLLLPGASRIVLEVDGKQHYAKDDIADPDKYAQMVALDRELKLLGYEVYRFGGYELVEGNKSIIVSFFDKLFKKHGILSGEL